jgi:hypothetical protein
VELLQAVTKSILSKPQPGSDYTVAVDPLTGGDIKVCCGNLEKMLVAIYPHLAKDPDFPTQWD